MTDNPKSFLFASAAAVGLLACLAWLFQPPSVVPIRQGESQHSSTTAQPVPAAGSRRMAENLKAFLERLEQDGRKIQSVYEHLEAKGSLGYLAPGENQGTWINSRFSFISWGDHATLKVDPEEKHSSLRKVVIRRGTELDVFRFDPSTATWRAAYLTWRTPSHPEETNLVVNAIPFYLPYGPSGWVLAGKGLSYAEVIRLMVNYGDQISLDESDPNFILLNYKS